jgi:hypothetical protein
MKKLFLFFAIIISLNAFAQKTEAFFSSDSSGIQNIVNRIMEHTANEYHLDKIFNKRNDVTYWYRHDEHDKIDIHFQKVFDSTWMLKTMYGKYEDIFPFWKNYFDESADMKATEIARKGRVASKPFSKGQVEFYFTRIGSDWQIKLWYGPVRKIKET